MDPWLSALLLVVAGIVAGTINVVAGGGSFLTLPILIFLGLPAGVANATNRVGVLVQNVSSVWAFRRRGVLDWPWALWSSLPASIGAIAGAWLALIVSDVTFRRVLAVIMLVVALWTFVARRLPLEELPHPRAHFTWTMPAFFAVGLYGGFIQAGVGFLVLAITNMVGLDLVRANAIKVFVILLLTGLSLLIFSWHGTVDWTMGSALAVGNLIGGLMGVRVAMVWGDRWLQYAIAVTILIFAVALLLER
jgi:uncharacterized protein